MSIEIQCPCGKRYKVDDRFAGRTMACKACGNKLVVSAPPAPDDLPTFADESEYELAPPTQPPAARSFPATSPPPLIPGGRVAPLPTGGLTFASNAGQLHLDIGQFFRTHVPLLVVALAVMVVGALLSVFILKMYGLWWLWLLIGPYVIYSQISTLRGKLVSGDVCPAVVIGDKPLRVAVWTDLTTGDGSFPAVYVMNTANLAKAVDGPPAVGDRLATIAYYSGPPVGGAWQGFDPTPVPTVTRNRADIQRVTASITADQWEELDRAVAELPSAEPGLYRLEPHS